MFLHFGNNQKDIKKSDADPQFYTEKNYIQSVGRNFLPKYPNRSRYMIYECKRTCGGLGDRQKGIVGAYLMSLLTNRTFGIKHTKPMDITPFVLPNKIIWTVNQSKLEGLSQEIHNAVGRLDFLEKLPGLDLNKFYSKDIVYFNGNQEYVRLLRKHYDAARVFPDIMRMSNSEIYNLILRLLFKLEHSLQKKLNMVLKKDINGRKLICAHVRMGRNPTIPTDTEKRLNMDKINSIWKFLDRFNMAKKYSVFVASDSNELIKYARNKFPLQFVDVPGPIIHMDQIGYKNESRGMTKIFLEQILLSQCDVLVVTKSGFGRIAAYLRNSSRDLYCFLNGIVFPCRHDLLNQIYFVR